MGNPVTEDINLAALSCCRRIVASANVFGEHLGYPSATITLGAYRLAMQGVQAKLVSAFANLVARAA